MIRLVPLTVALLAALCSLSTGRSVPYHHRGYYRKETKPEKKVSGDVETKGYGYGYFDGYLHKSDDYVSGAGQTDSYSGAGYGKARVAGTGKGKKTGGDFYAHSLSSNYGGAGSYVDVYGDKYGASGYADSHSDAYGYKSHGAGYSKGHVKGGHGRVKTHTGSDSYENAYGYGSASGDYYKDYYGEISSGHSSATGASGSYGKTKNDGYVSVKGKKTSVKSKTHNTAYGEGYGHGDGYGIADEHNAYADGYAESQSKKRGGSVTTTDTEAKGKYGRKASTHGVTKSKGKGGAVVYNTASTDGYYDHQSTDSTIEAYSGKYGKAYGASSTKAQKSDYDGKVETHGKASTKGKAYAGAYNYADQSGDTVSVGSGGHVESYGGSGHASSTAKGKGDGKKHHY